MELMLVVREGTVFLVVTADCLSSFPSSKLEVGIYRKRLDLTVCSFDVNMWESIFLLPLKHHNN